MDVLTQLKGFTQVVADTGDFHSIEAYKPTDATTNPSLILKAAGKEEYADLRERALRDGRSRGLAYTMDLLFVEFGLAILQLIPGRVSTEVDARLSFDPGGTIEKARRLVGLYEQRGIPRERILIKIAATWEGIQAAGVLEQEGIRCNLTLLFSTVQAAACAEAKATLISPFVGRILDWYRMSRGVEAIPASQDPGVLSVKEIYSYYKSRGIKTEIMGASFRNKEEILELAGCDLLTISPALLEELRNARGTLARQLSPDRISPTEEIPPGEAPFRWRLNENPMAMEKLADGIRRFAADQVLLESQINRQL